MSSNVTVMSGPKVFGDWYKSAKQNDTLPLQFRNMKPTTIWQEWLTDEQQTELKTVARRLNFSQQHERGAIGGHEANEIPDAAASVPATFSLDENAVIYDAQRGVSPFIGSREARQQRGNHQGPAESVSPSSVRVSAYISIRSIVTTIVVSSGS